MKRYMNKDCLEIGCREFVVTSEPTIYNQVEILIIPISEYEKKVIKDYLNEQKTTEQSKETIGEKIDKLIEKYK